VDTGEGRSGRKTRRITGAVEGKCGILSFFFAEAHYTYRSHPIIKDGSYMYTCR